VTTHIPEHGAPDDDCIIDCASCQDHLHELALGILPEDLSASMIDHIDICAACRAEYGRMRRTTRLLPFLAEPTEPEPAAKDLLLARIARVAQDEAEPPVVLHNPWASMAEDPQPTPPATSSDRPSIWQRWVMPGVVAPLAICLILLSAWANSLRNEVDHLRESGSQEIALAEEAASSPYELQLYEFRPACENCAQSQASGKFGGNPDGTVGVVVAWNLDPDETHQVWCINHMGEKLLITDLEVEGGNVFQTVNFPEAIGGYQQIYVARHDGTEDPDAELLVAMNDPQQTDPPASTPESTVDD